MLRTNRSSFRKKGMSTVLGTLIFIGILFSAVVPMFLVMKQADIILDQKKLEIRRVDDDRSREMMDVYAYPVSGQSQLELKINSRCELPINILHLWINNTLQDVDITILPMEQEKILGPYNVPTKAGTDSEFNVKVTSGRGNVYESLAGVILYDGSESEWRTETLQVVVIIGSQGSFWFGLFGSYRATITGGTPAIDTITKTWTIGTCIFNFDVTDWGPGTYHLLVEKKTGGWWNPNTWTEIYNEDVSILWPGGPAVVEIYL